MGWLSNVHKWWRDDFLGPRNTWRFKTRISMRVRWLRLKAWAGEQRRRDVRRHLPRPIVLLAIGFAIPLVVLWLLELRFRAEVGGVGTAFQTFLTKGGEGQLEWREALQLLLLVIGLPSAFILWLFRDIHVNETLANQRKDVNLKEFQEIQMRAAGALDEKYPAHARETLQIAALHQLRSFLRGDYGESFRRPAWELLRARMATSARETGTRAIVESVEAHDEAQPDSGLSRVDWAEAKVTEIRRAMAAVAPHAVANAERAVIREDSRSIFRADLPLTGTCFDLIDVSGPRSSAGALLASRALSQCSFIGANLREAHLEGADLSGAHLEGADLSGSHLEGADLGNAHLEGADLSGSHLEGANLREAHLEGADLSQAHLGGADLRRAHLEGADLREVALEGADLFDAHLGAANLSGVHLKGPGLYTVHFRASNLSGAHLEGAKLRWAHLQGANLSNANLRGADLFEAYFEGANLTNVHLGGADLRRAHFEGADLREARLQAADLRRAHLEGANLSGANLENADLSGAHLEGAILHRVNFNDAQLIGAIFDDATIFVGNWSGRTEVELEAIRDEFIERGMVHVDDPPPVEDPL